MKTLILVLITLVTIGCSSGGDSDSGLSIKIDTLLNRDKTEIVDLTMLGNDNWDRVCFFGPYTRDANKALGFDWDIKKETSIEESDSINVIAFVKNENVVDFVEYPRKKGDFAKLSGQCFLRGDAKFSRKTDADGWVNYSK